MKTTKQHNELLVSFGNTKLPKSTMIINMGSARHCPAKAKGFCSVPGCCYAGKAEKMYYTTVLPYRNRQQSFWLNNTAEQIIVAFDAMLSRKRKLPTHLRFNEAGDFHSQECIDKLNIIAKHLLDKYSITTYGYTARKDLDFEYADFLVKGSNNTAGNNGMTKVFKTAHDILAYNVTHNENFVTCPGNCKTCDICAKSDGVNVAFIQH